MVIIFILLLVLFFFYLLDKSMEKFLGISMLKDVEPEILIPKNKVDETELVKLNTDILRDVDELMFSSKEGDTIYEYTSV